jgi:hypothetical protein
LSFVSARSRYSIRHQSLPATAMPRHRQSLANLDDSDALSSCEDDEVFDVDEFEGDSDTDATSAVDLDVDDDSDAEIDFEDQTQLFGGNVHPPEYYQQAVEEFNESAFDSEDYSPGSNLLLAAVEEQWRLYEARNPLPSPLADHPRAQVLQCSSTRPSTVFPVYLDSSAL